MTEKYTITNDLQSDEFEEKLESAIEEFEHKISAKDYQIDLVPFLQLLEKGKRWDDLTYYVEEAALEFDTKANQWEWKIKVAIHNHQFYQVEEWMQKEELISVLGMDRILELRLLCEKEKSEFTQSEVVKLQQLSEKLKKDEVLSEEQNSYIVRTLTQMQTPLKWSVVESFLSSANTQLFWKGFLVEYWLKEGPSKRINFYDAFSNNRVEISKENTTSVYENRIFIEIESLISKQAQLSEEMKELLLQKLHSDFVRVAPFAEKHFKDAGEWVETQLQREDLLLSLYEGDASFIKAHQTLHNC